MNRRVRHLNPANAGALLALDARFLTGFADGDAVGTWSRPGSISLTQSGSARPTYKTAILNGQPTVRFDGVDDNMQNGAQFTTSKDVTFIFVCKWAASGSITVLFTNGRSDANGQCVYENAGSIVWLHAGQAAVALGVSVQSSATIYTFSINQTASEAVKLWFNGAEQSTTASAAAMNTPSGVTAVAANQDPNYFASTDQYAVIGLGSVASAALRRRIEQSLAFSFRIACA